MRIIHIPTGIVVTSTAQRTQQMNRSDAINKLKVILIQMNYDTKADQKNSAWREHTRLQRGNPIRVYRGYEFVLTRK